MAFGGAIAHGASWPVLFLIILVSHASRSLAQSNETPLQLISTNRTASEYRGAFASNFECPGVCPGCPPCPNCPACPGSPPCPRAIPPGYHYYEGFGYYKKHLEWLNWFAAKAACEREGGDLVVINSKEEASLLGSMVDNPGSYNRPIYVGMFRSIDYFVTVHGDTLSSTGYMEWAPGQPSDTENCGSFFYPEGYSLINCGITRQFICKL